MEFQLPIDQGVALFYNLAYFWNYKRPYSRVVESSAYMKGWERSARIIIPEIHIFWNNHPVSSRNLE